MDVSVITACKRSLGQGNLFTGVSYSVPRGVCIQGIYIRGVYYWGVCIRGEGSAFRGMAANSLPDTWDTTGYSQLAHGTHPTGMYSCLKNRFTCNISFAFLFFYTVLLKHTCATVSLCCGFHSYLLLWLSLEG